MAEIGDIIQSGESIPADVTRLTDRDEDPWSRVGESVLSGVWQCDKGRPGDVRSGDIVSLEWGPLTVTAVREPEPAAGPTTHAAPDTPVLVFRSSSGRTEVARRADGFSVHVLFGSDRLSPGEASRLGSRLVVTRVEQLAAKLNAEPGPQQSDVSVLDLVRQYGNARVFASGALYAGKPDVQHEHLAAADALLDRIAALLPQQPVQARNGRGNFWWLHECGTPSSFENSPGMCVVCAEPGPWRPLLVGGTRTPEAETPEAEAYSRGFTDGRDNAGGDLIAQVMEALGVDRPEDVLPCIRREWKLHEEASERFAAVREQRDEARADAADYAARLKATDAALAKVAAQRDEASAEVERLKAMLVEIAPAPADPLVLSLPEVPEGAVALIVQASDDGGDIRFVRTEGGWHRGPNDVHGVWSVAKILDMWPSARVELAPPREARTWPKLADAPVDLKAVRGESGEIWRCNQAAGMSWDCDALGAYGMAFGDLQQFDGPLTEVFDEPGGEQR